ncbi:MAG: hypothetical protein LUQ60_03455 [Methanomicrobiales archaeon]|nr:hypothetical protein [Methanomicrobiales archaeon]
MSSNSLETPEERGRRLAKAMVRDTIRDLLLTDPEFRDSIRPVLKSLVREILQEERLLPLGGQGATQKGVKAEKAAALRYLDCR